MYNYATLPNGIRLIHKQTSSEISHVGVMVNTGTRDELPQESGIAHFIEHVIFKGTSKRNTYQVLSYLENVGGELNAYTTKEETFFYASVLNVYLPRAVELLADIVFHSTFNPKDIEKEKDVVKEEINLYKDTPSELIFDEFENQIFNGHPLGTNILGSIRSLKNITQSKINTFIQRTYNTNEIVIAMVGNVDFKKYLYHVEKYFVDIAQNNRQFERQNFKNYTVSHRKMKVHNNQSHLVLGQVLPDYEERKNLTAALLNNVLGGTGLNSRLNMAVREKKGYVYQIESNYSALSDTGLITIYVGCDNKNIDKCFELIYRELKKLRQQRLGTMQLQRARLQFIGQTCIFYESNLNEMLSICKNHLIFNHVDDLNGLIQKIQTITAEELLEIANETLNENTFSSLIMSK